MEKLRCTKYNSMPELIKPDPEKKIISPWRHVGPSCQRWNNGECLGDEPGMEKVVWQGK
jgi:hypothetical protein